MAGAPTPPEFNNDYLAEDWHCTPSQAREEDEIDIEIHWRRMRVEREVAALRRHRQGG